MYASFLFCIGGPCFFLFLLNVIFAGLGPAWLKCYPVACLFLFLYICLQCSQILSITALSLFPTYSLNLQFSLLHWIQYKMFSLSQPTWSLIDKIYLPCLSDFLSWKKTLWAIFIAIFPTWLFRTVTLWVRK